MKYSDDMEQVLDLLYEQRAVAIDPERSWQMRHEAWIAIDGLLDWYNELRVI